MVEKQTTSLDGITSDRRNFWLGFILWALIILSYFIFVLNWLLPLSLAGFKYQVDGIEHKVLGWGEAFFGRDGTQSELQRSIANWGVTAARGIATLFLGLLVAKFSHKRATILSLALLSVGFLGVFVNNYWLFLATRFVMAIGGTTLIVLIQPIISRFFSPGQRSYFSQISPMAYPLAGLFSFLLVSSISSRSLLTNYWRLTIAILGALCLVFLFLYIIFGKDFDILQRSDSTSVGGQNVKPNTYLGIIKEKQTWFWIALYGFWLIAYVLPTVTLPNVLIAWNPELQTHNGGNWKGIFGSLVFIGSLIGFLGGFYNKTKLPRKYYIFTTIFLFWVGLLFLILSGLYSGFRSQFFSYLGAFIIGFTSIAMQTVMLNMPHEYGGNTPKRMAIFMSYIWGGGYIIYTIVDALTSQLLDVYKLSQAQGYFPILPLLPTLLVFAFLMVVMFFIKESKPRALNK